MKNYLNNIDREALKERANQMLGYANDAQGTLSRWADYGLSKAHSFSFGDFVIFKVCLLTCGLWLGSVMAKVLKKFRGILFIVFLTSWVYLIWRVFFDDNGADD